MQFTMRLSNVFTTVSLVRSLGALLVLCSASNAGMAQNQFTLQDSAPSPSDGLGSTNAPVQLAPIESALAQPSPNQVAPSQLTPIPAPNTAMGPANQSFSDSVAPQPLSGNLNQPPQTPRPNVASLGNNQFNTLTRSNYYVSPIALSLGGSPQGASSVASSYFGSATHRNLLKTPEMFGDFRRPGFSLAFNSLGTTTGEGGENEPVPGTDFPTAGSFSGLRVSENNVALPQDRVWTSYSFFNNSYALQTGDVDLDRFTLGFEKTFDEGSSSVEFRLPMAGSLNPVDPTGNSSFAAGSFGNLSVILKRVLLATEDRVIAVGLSVETPTGSQTHASDVANGQVDITLSPSAVYLTPYIGTLREFDDIYFVNSFLQLDVATSGDRLLASFNGNPAQEFFINQPALMQFDIGGGVWLTTPTRQRIGVAVSTELHIATALTEDDTFLVDPAGGAQNVAIDINPIRTLVNWTNGIHAQLDENWSVRSAVSVPLLEDRIFDTEFILQVNRNF